MYDADEGTHWFPRGGTTSGFTNSWVEIQFNGVTNISKVEVLQACSERCALFKKMRLTFSRGQSEILSLSPSGYEWNGVTFNPPVSAISNGVSIPTFLRITEIELYNTFPLSQWSDGIPEIRFFGSILAGKQTLFFMINM